MAWRLPSPRSLASVASTLRRDRDRLTATIAPQLGERRGEFRMFHPGIEGIFSKTGAVLLNMSRSGLAVGVRRKCAFARGERYLVSLREGQTQADIESEVCWTRSIWHQESPGNDRKEYFQTAGLTISNPLTPEEEEIWRLLRERVQDGSTSLEMTISQVSD